MRALACSASLLLLVLLLAACGDGDPAAPDALAAGDADEGVDIDGSVAADAAVTTPDAAAAADAGPPPCGVLDFEDALGSVGLADYLTGANTETIGGVVFTAAADEGVTNGGTEIAQLCPFTSDWLGLWSFADGGTIRFPAPVAAVELVAGAVSTDTPSGFEVYAGGELVETFSIIGTELTAVTILLFEASDTLLFKNVSGTTSLLGIDDLRYVAGDCSP